MARLSSDLHTHGHVYTRTHTRTHAVHTHARTHTRAHMHSHRAWHSPIALFTYSLERIVHLSCCCLYRIHRWTFERPFTERVFGSYLSPVTLILLLHALGFLRKRGGALTEYLVWMEQFWVLACAFPRSLSMENWPESCAPNNLSFFFKETIEFFLFNKINNGLIQAFLHLSFFNFLMLIKAAVISASEERRGTFCLTFLPKVSFL